MTVETTSFLPRGSKKTKPVMRFVEFMIQNRRKLQILRETLTKAVLEEKMKLDKIQFENWRSYIQEIFALKLSKNSDFRRKEKIITKMFEKNFSQSFVAEHQQLINEENSSKLINLLELNFDVDSVHDQCILPMEE